MGDIRVWEKYIDDRAALYCGDTTEIITQFGDESVDMEVYSPPFSSLYTYSNSARDLGNCDSDEQFIEHFRFIVKEMLRITAPGRLCSFHCMNLPTSKVRDGHLEGPCVGNAEDQDTGAPAQAGHEGLCHEQAGNP